MHLKSNSSQPWSASALAGVALCTVLAGCASQPIASSAAGNRPGEGAHAVETPPQEQHYQAARAALMRGDMDKARLEVMLALQDNPLDAKAHFLLGCLLAQKGEYDQAIVGFQRTATLDPANSEAMYNLGTLLLRRGEPVPAARLLENAVLISPEHVPSYNNLAKAYYEAGLPELAVATYDEALLRDPPNAIALKNHALLAKVTGNQNAAAAPSATNAAPKAPAVPATQPANADDPEATALRELIRDLPHVTVERRGGRLTLIGWTSGPAERLMLDRILGKPAPVPGQPALPVAENQHAILDLTGDDAGDPNRMLEIDAILFIVRGLDSQSVGFNFLKEINLNFNYFALDNQSAGTGFTAPPAVTGVVSGLSQQGWIFGAAADYVVNIANALDQKVAVLARPHLTTLSGTPAKFLAGGELIYTVSGNVGGNIFPYLFGTTLDVTPTLLRSPAEDGSPRVHVRVEAGRSSVLSLLENIDPNQPTLIEETSIASEAVLSVGQTLILSGISQRESRSSRDGVPILMDIPLIKYLFSTETTTTADSAVIILLTPRDPAFWDGQNSKDTAAFVEKRRAFLKARQGTEEDMQRFRERYPDWNQIAPSRFASHFFLLENSELYRAVSGQDLTSDDLDLQLLVPRPNKKNAPK